MKRNGLSLLFALSWSYLSSIVHGANLTVSTVNGNASSALLYGFIFELLKNNGFQGDSPGLTAYGAVGNVNISQDTSNPLSSAITSTLRVDVPANTTGLVGFSNSGYLGVPVFAQNYTNYFYIKGSYTGTLTLQLVGNSSGTVYASQDTNVTSNSTAFTYVDTSFSSTQAPDGNNVWQVLFDASQVQGSGLNFGLPQLFPPTYYSRYNGLREDAASFLAEVNPSFLRFPGGNNLEGSTPDTRWKWNNTIGPVINRPGRQGDWTYPNTDALGLNEYLQWCADMEMAPILAVWSGLSLGGGVVSGDALDPYVDDIMNELEYLLGNSSTTYGSLRAANGYPDPWPVEHVEVGNEDNLNGGCSTYADRFTQIYDAIHAEYPGLMIIASTTDSSCLPSPIPDGVWTDIHYYLSPDSFVSLFNMFDNWNRSQPILVGEYASTVGNDGSATNWTNVLGSCGEAVFMIGMERNSDVVLGASFAPLMEHFDLAEWSPDLVGLNSDPDSITGSTSYYVQQMFSTNRGSTVLPVDSDVGFGPLYWVASSSSSNYYVKLANYGTSEQEVTVNLNSTSSGQLQMLSGAPDASNYPQNVTVTTQTSTVSGVGSYTFTMPAYAVAVLAVAL